MRSSVGSVPVQSGGQASLTDEPDSADLDALAKRGQMFSRLYRQHVTEIYRYCFRLLGNRHDAEDATSQVFTKALAAFDAPAADMNGARSWLFTIAHNVTIDMMRQRRSDAWPADAAELPDRAPPMEERVVVGDDLRTLHRLLAALSPDQRQVVELRLSGLTGAEIAAVLGRRRGAIDGLQFRAVAKLRQLFAAQGQGQADASGRKDCPDARH